MGIPGLARICLRDKVRRASGLARPWRALALLAALETEPDTVPDLLLAAQRFFSGHPFSSYAYDGLLGAIRRVGLDRRYTEAPGSHGLAVIDLEARRVRYEVRGIGWRRTGWLYYHDGEAFTNRRVPFRIPESWQVEGAAEDRTPLVEWNEGGPEPFGFLLVPDA
ncbi:MAG TPA: hypothetical protein VGX21_17215 [Methylomirabilota bacterium]|jgi:hypothetical protein|nr:hypothetical protein [Methylomirabilota bacterium]